MLCRRYPTRRAFFEGQSPLEENGVLSRHGTGRGPRIACRPNLRYNCRAPAADLPLRIVPNRPNPKPVSPRCVPATSPPHPLHPQNTPSVSLFCIICRHGERLGVTRGVTGEPWNPCQTRKVGRSQGEWCSVKLARMSNAKTKGTYRERSTCNAYSFPRIPPTVPSSHLLPPKNQPLRSSHPKNDKYPVPNSAHEKHPILQLPSHPPVPRPPRRNKRRANPSGRSRKRKIPHLPMPASGEASFQVPAMRAPRRRA